MDQTPVYGFPFPECEPPLVADASDIEQMRDLAVAIDTVVTTIDNNVAQVLSHPDACRMMSATNVPVAGDPNGTTATVNYSLFNFDNTPGQLMTDTAAGVVRIQETGWYLIGHWITAAEDPIPGALPRARFLVNGSPASGFTHRAPAGGRDFQGYEVLRLNAQDSVTSQISMGTGTGSIVYTARIWALQLLVV